MIRYVAQTGSTSADLAAALRAGERLPEGEWLIAERQTHGKGRGGRHWIDGEGNFMGSTLVRPGKGDPPTPTLSFVAGLALHAALRQYLAVSLKWPNDVMFGEAKLAGVLLELAEDCVIIGIGVNLVRAPELPDRQTIALAELVAPPTVSAFGQALDDALSRELELWRGNGMRPLLDRWLAAAHPLGTALSVEEPGGRRISGTFAGLAVDGALQLRLADGSVRAIHAGEVLFA